MNAVLLRFAPHLVAVIVFALALFGAYRHGVTVTRMQYELLIAQRDKENASALAELQAKAREQEREAIARTAAIEQSHQEKLQHEISSRDAVISDLRSGSLQLRKRFACPAGNGVSSTSASAAVGNASAATGLQAQDGEFLIREAGRADEVVLQLQACQAFVRVSNTGKKVDSTK